MSNVRPSDRLTPKATDALRRALEAIRELQIEDRTTLAELSRAIHEHNECSNPIDVAGIMERVSESAAGTKIDMFKDGEKYGYEPDWSAVGECMKEASHV